MSLAARTSPGPAEWPAAAVEADASAAGEPSAGAVPSVASLAVCSGLPAASRGGGGRPSSSVTGVAPSAKASWPSFLSVWPVDGARWLPNDFRRPLCVDEATEGAAELLLEKRALMRALRSPMGS